MLLIGCVGAEQPEPTLRSLAPFPIGAALSPKLLTNHPDYRRTVEQEFSSITSENVLKMHHVHPEKDRYDFSGGDALVTYAARTGKRMHGHALVWHEAVPKWVTEFQGDSATWEGLLRDHIKTVVRNNIGQIAAWDVVNEAFMDDGTLRKSIWSEKLGPDFVARAFRYAREFNPGVKLFYNDYGQEYSPRKLAAILNMVADFKRRGVPIDGIGLQMHTNVNQSDSLIENALRRTAATGLLVHISELDVRVNPGKLPNFTPTDEHWQRQRQKYAAIVRAYRRAVPKDQQYGITFWNVSDGDSWIPKFCQCQDFPLPFDARYRRKPAYTGISESLSDK